MPGKKYTQAQRLAYYKKLALKNNAIAGSGAYRRKAPIRGRGAYRAPSRRRVRGRGAYKEEGYGAIGRRIGTNIGSGLGELAGEAVKFFTGRGSYGVMNNSLLVDDPMMPPIKNRVDKPGSVIIRKSEYIADIISSSSTKTFLNSSYSVNPGLAATFQWLSQVAVNFEEYEFCGMYFEYRTMSADALNSVDTALGQVILAMDYNASNAAFTSKSQMENYEAAISVKPSQSVRYFVECAKKLNVLSELYVRGGPVPSNDDVRLYDLGNFQVATNGFQGTSVNCGELWVTYEVCLIKSKLFSNLGMGVPFYGAVISGYSAASPLNTLTAYSNNSLVMASTATTLTFPITNSIAYYMCYLEWIGTGAAVLVHPTLTATAGCSLQTQRTPNDGDTAKSLCWVFFVKTTGLAQPVVTIGTGGTLPTSVANGTLFITQMSPIADLSSF